MRLESFKREAQPIVSDSNQVGDSRKIARLSHVAHTEVPTSDPPAVATATLAEDSWVRSFKLDDPSGETTLLYIIDKHDDAWRALRVDDIRATPPVRLSRITDDRGDSFVLRCDGAIAAKLHTRSSKWIAVKKYGSGDEARAFAESEAQRWVRKQYEHLLEHKAVYLAAKPVMQHMAETYSLRARNLSDMEDFLKNYSTSPLAILKGFKNTEIADDPLHECDSMHQSQEEAPEAVPDFAAYYLANVGK